MSKTKELIFHRPNPRNLPPSEMNGIERVSFTKLLGVWLQDDMGTSKQLGVWLQDDMGTSKQLGVWLQDDMGTSKQLEVWLQDDMGTSKHVDYVTHISNRLLYLLNQIKKQGLLKAELLSVFEAIVLTRILYASPAWSGYASANNIESLQRVLIKAKRWRIVEKDYRLVD